MTAARIGLVVNPVAGLGGRVALKGSDGAPIQRRALALGAVPRAGARAAAALGELAVRHPRLTVLTAEGAMGADAVRAAGLTPHTVYAPGPGDSTPADTVRAVRALRSAGAGLLLFAGGDGTARDVLDALAGEGDVPVLGIPAGVKMHSSVFAVHPRAAGLASAAWAEGRVRLRDAEVMDRDEEALRADRIATRLYGWLTVPDVPSRVQRRKTGSAGHDPGAVAGIAAEVAARVGAGGLLVMGAGTTTRDVARALGADGTSLSGVDVLRLRADGAEVVLRDARADQLLGLATPWLALSPVGGQGFLLGRGNQQITPQLLRAVGRDRLLVLCTEAKLAELAGRPLLVDTDDDTMDAELAGHLRVVTGRHSSAMYRLSR
jgi:predicted polyphosphate/ATP-dependent NAD kinase